MHSYATTEWARRRFGDVAGDLAQAIPAGMQEAHRRAVAAHLASELSTNDAYGAALKVTSHEQLIDGTKSLPGVVARKPTGVVSRFPYVVIEDTSVVLVPWRFASTRNRRRVDARVRTPLSDLRKSLFGLGAGVPVPTQLVLEQSALDSEELEAQLAEEQNVYEQLSSFGRVVTVAYGSSPTDGLFEIGWGDAELISEDTGQVHWHHWEALPIAEPGEGGLGMPAAAPLRPVGPVNGTRLERFDDAPLSEDLGLATRPQPVAAPLSESQPEVDQAGDEDRQS